MPKHLAYKQPYAAQDIAIITSPQQTESVPAIFIRFGARDQPLTGGLLTIPWSVGETAHMLLASLRGTPTWRIHCTKWLLSGNAHHAKQKVIAIRDNAYQKDTQSSRTRVPHPERNHRYRHSRPCRKRTGLYIHPDSLHGHTTCVTRIRGITRLDRITGMGNIDVRPRQAMTQLCRRAKGGFIATIDGRLTVAYRSSKVVV